MVALGKEVIEAWISCFQLQPRTLRFMATSGTDSSNDSWVRYCARGLPAQRPSQGEGEPEKDGK